MKLLLAAVVAASLLLAGAWTVRAQDQEAGQQLTFPKGEVTEHPSDIHLGSDPYYKKAPQKYQGSDESGYKKDYDPSMQYYEETTTYQPVKGKKGKRAPEGKSDEPPTRWDEAQ